MRLAANANYQINAIVYANTRRNQNHYPSKPILVTLANNEIKLHCRKFTG
jgi:hypothetical protein